MAVAQVHNRYGNVASSEEVLHICVRAISPNAKCENGKFRVRATFSNAFIKARTRVGVGSTNARWRRYAKSVLYINALEENARTRLYSTNATKLMYLHKVSQFFVVASVRRQKNEKGEAKSLLSERRYV